MDRRLRIAGIIGALAVSAAILLSPSQGVPLPEPTTTQEEGSGSVEVLATAPRTRTRQTARRSMRT
ncbi:MAG: hypothetical protein EB833_01635 [Thaumarchaeota archaeon S13]|nr:MAG: hypothetical protein EB833_01635 [Thaumarchaeota archaeon S13]